MTFDDYQDQAMSFRLPEASPEYALFNLAGEVGELLSLEAKSIRDGIEFPTDFVSSVKKELGDILWHVAAIATDYGWSLEDVAYTNIEKLTSRKQRGVLTGSGDNR